MQRKEAQDCSVATAIEVDFDGMASHGTLLAAILAEVEQLQSAGLACCHIVISAPQGDGRYGVRLRLALAGGADLVIDTCTGTDARHADPLFAVSDAFRHARSRLQTDAAPRQAPARRKQGGGG